MIAQSLVTLVIYLAIGFCFGIFREWAWQGRSVREDHPWRYRAASFCFPISSTAPGTELTFVKNMGGGILYWILIAFVWPFCLIWTIFVFFSDALESLSQKIKIAGQPFEQWVRGKCDIAPGS